VTVEPQAEAKGS